ncbi:hypothetical protein TRICI_004856 [Trichomonascus ciferrii]|uniref:SGF29 C-terminal domain-containing protein n=1 Tax=Trichomonascus ciferrii TaxID=44093 RepID=A0A642UYX7_9ASCO|nr:hypothetical protein TRICI_004856 [Trichomonascus ciferrii]
MAARARSRAAANASPHEELWRNVVNNVKSAHERSAAIAVADDQHEHIPDLTGIEDLDGFQGSLARLVAEYEAEKQGRVHEYESLKSAQSYLTSLVSLRAERDHTQSPGAGGPPSKKKRRNTSPPAPPATTSGKPTLGSQVAFHLSKVRNTPEEEWIQCEVTKVYTEGVRYEVQDPEPDENNNPGQSYKAGIRDLILIPNPDDTHTINALPHLPPGAQVIARYPETTTFYRAEVIAMKRDGKCRLKFEGEEEEGKETEVERRLVHPLPK